MASTAVSIVRKKRKYKKPHPSSFSVDAVLLDIQQFFCIFVEDKRLFFFSQGK